MREVIRLIQSLERTDANLIQSIDEFDKAIDHIVRLIQDSSLLYLNGSYPSSAFLSITACEEVAKAHIGPFTDGTHPDRKGRNVFRDHKTKHQMAAMPTISMGKRLEDALGKEDLQRIMSIGNHPLH